MDRDAARARTALIEVLTQVLWETGWSIVPERVLQEDRDEAAKLLDALLAARQDVPCPTCHNEGVVERLATPDEVDEGCELGIAYDPCPNEAHHNGPRGPLLVDVLLGESRGS